MTATFNTTATARRLALFDLDHTLLPLDSDYQWADFLARHGHAGDPQAARRKNDELMAAYNAGSLTAQDAAAFMLGLLAPHAPETLARWHAEFMAEVIEPAITARARAQVADHQNAGDLCAIVTATNRFVTAPIARAFGVDHLIATEPEMAAGRYTGRIKGVASFREGKITRVRDWLAGMYLTLENFAATYFYSDSVNDVPLLEVVSHPVATNPSTALHDLALARGWPVLHLFDQLQDHKS